MPREPRIPGLDELTSCVAWYATAIVVGASTFLVLLS